MQVCSRCKNYIREFNEHRPRGLGHSTVQYCMCGPLRKPETLRKEPTQTITYVSPAPSIADQLAVLAKLRKEGSLTEQEFQTLKARLIDGGNS